MDFLTHGSLPFALYADLDLLALRIVLAAIFVMHGIQKAGAWKNAGMPMRSVMKVLSVAEPLGALALAVGFLTPIAASALSLIMLGAIWMKVRRWHVPFTTHQGTGWEFDLLILAALCVLSSSGAGSMSVDALLSVAR